MISGVSGSFKKLSAEKEGFVPTLVCLAITGFAENYF
jgi:hypothetical protein